jgi:putative alpha-1,2-mannosidase
MGNFPVFAHPGCPGDDWKRCNYTMSERMLPRVNGSVVSTAGYMSINLTNSVRTEMTAAMKTSLFRFTFSPEQNISYYREISNSTVTTASNPVIQIEINDLSSTRYHGGVQVYPGSGRIIGDGTFSPSFGVGEYRAYFCADFKGAKILHTGVFEGWHAFGHRQYLQEIARGSQNPSNAGGAWIHFEHPENHQILARVGMSFVSVDQACENAEADIPDFDFERTVQAAQDAWRTKFSAVEVDATGLSEDLQQVFWSGLYRSFLSPQNYTGENPLWNSTEPYFDSFYCIWDSFRAQHPLISLIDPAAQAEMVRTLLDVYRFVGG